MSTQPLQPDGSRRGVPNGVVAAFLAFAYDLYAVSQVDSLRSDSTLHASRLSFTTSGLLVIRQQHYRSDVHAPGFEDHTVCSERFGKFATLHDSSTTFQDGIWPRSDPR
jgi:hypothetical protein